MIRHGKSDWGNPYQDDFDRALNHRGILDAKNMGDHLKNYSNPDSIISSSAKRAITTAHLLAQQLNFNENGICDACLFTEKKKNPLLIGVPSFGN